MAINGAATVGSNVPAEPEAPSIDKLRKQFLDYLGSKSDEIKEQREARHYYHGDPWTAEEIAILNARKQPVVTYPFLARKIDGVVGLLERLRQDPKAYPRTPEHEEGAELATATLRYVLDEADWKAKSPEAVRSAATEGLNGIALKLTQGDHGDPEIDLEPVDTDTFFYDPRSFRADFSDARYMGISKWIDEESAISMFPDREAEIRDLITSGAEFDSEASRDRAVKWTNTSGKQVRIVEHWYKQKGQWAWCFYAGDTLLGNGASPYIDEKGQSICRFIMFSAAVDHDGDRYGFPRNLKSAVDEIHHRRSRALYETMGRRIIARRGTLADVEKTRKEAVRADGIIEWDTEEPKFDDNKSDAQFKANLEMLAEAKSVVQDFGPNQALIGEGSDTQSGRAIALLQQAGLAELGPFIIAHRGWKIRVYRAIWNAIQKHWTAERWVRVTDDDGLKQFIQVNGIGLDQQGAPALINSLGSLDVDIILDEGPDTINMQADALETLKNMGPAFIERFPELYIELAPLPASLKKKMKDKIEAQSQPDPAQEQLKQITVQGEAAKVEKTQSETQKNMAQAHQAMQPEPQQMPTAQAPKGPSESINFKDIPPEAQAQMLAQAGIIIHPALLAAHAAMQAQQQTEQAAQLAHAKASATAQHRQPQQVS